MGRAETALKYFNEQKEVMDLRVKSGIELHRKGDATITFVAANGELPKEITLEVRQKSHEFKFGCNIFMLDELETEEKNAIYKEKFPECFNLATVPFYWSDLEPEQGKPRYAADSPKIYRRPSPDLCVNYCKEKGIEPKCHCLNYDNFTPDWVKDRTVTEHKALLEKRFREIAERYAKDIPSFEVTNETLQNTKKSKFFYEDDFVDWSFRMADRYFPNNKLIINDYNIWWPESYNNRHAYYMQIERALKNGCRIDEIGIQFHMFYRRENELAKTKSYYNPRNILGVLDKFSEFKKPVQITEITFPAYSESSEDEEIQAEILKNVYSMWFSHEAVSGIIYWNLVDGYAAYAPQGDMTAGENYYYGGLFRFDFTPKPAYFMLRDLFKNQWRTKEVLASNQNGEIALRGFYGNYELEAEIDGKTYSVSVHHKKGEKSEFEICAE